MSCRWARLAAIALLVPACARNGSVRAALHGELSDLRAQIESERRAGELDRDRVVELARAVAAREVASGTGPSGVHRIRTMRGCTRPLLDVLEARSERADDGGAEAAQVLLAARATDAEALFERHAEASSGAFRAVAARAATRPEHFAQRRKYFVDFDERVRRAAFEAAIEAPSEADLDTLLESVRLDPSPVSQSLAARAAGAIGGERAVLALLDRWDRAEEETRLAIVDAWAMPRSLGRGGERELAKVAEGGRGLPALSAAAALVRAGGNQGAAAGNLLARAIAEGTTEERRYAMSVAPLGNTEVQRLLAEAEKDPDSEVRVAALTRSLELPSRRPAAIQALKKLGEGDTAVAMQARSALSTQGEASVRPALRAALQRGAAHARQAAALALVRLGDYEGAATALGDEDASLRASLACSILATEERSP